MWQILNHGINNHLKSLCNKGEAHKFGLKYLISFLKYTRMLFNKEVGIFLKFIHNRLQFIVTLQYFLLALRVLQNGHSQSKTEKETQVHLSNFH